MAAPEPGEQVAGARDVGDARRDVAQHAVARAVAERVVDQLEVVRVQVEQGDPQVRRQISARNVPVSGPMPA
jgi:hypothetical protein